jgi:hypothetical protein
VTSRGKILRQLLTEALYRVDERAVAEAILLRAAVLRTIPDVTLQRTQVAEPVRSFRRDARARSFRLATRRGEALAR